MINPLRQIVSVALAFSILSANGLLITPLPKKPQNNEESASMQNCCCCCNVGGGMSSTCCCAPRHAHGADRTTCSVTSAPCSVPSVALSPNVLDQWIEPQLGLNRTMMFTASEKFPSSSESPLSGKSYSLFHPPQYSFSYRFLS